MQILNIANPFKGAVVYYKDVTDSTMNDARTLIRNNPLSGTIVSAGEQLEGRGRIAGRKWLGGKNESLMFTLLIKEEDISFFKTLFPLYAGFCIMKCLEKYYNIESTIKWPNDVLVKGEKISGILCENTDRYILCGCGINLNQKDFHEFSTSSGKSAAGIQHSGARRPVSLYLLTGKETDPSDFLVKLLDIFSTEINECDWKDILEKRLYMYGENAVIREGIPGKTERIEGLIKGLGEYGQLLIEEKGKLREVYSGEIF